jgi:hypothetical protein
VHAQQQIAHRTRRRYSTRSALGLMSLREIEWRSRWIACIAASGSVGGTVIAAGVVEKA